MTAALPNTIAVDETTARRVLMVRAFETVAPDSPLWTEQDRAWATRLARETVDKASPSEHFVVERARHAVQRLEPRDADIGRWLNVRLGRGSWLWLAALVGLLSGLLMDVVGSTQRINLLAPPVWGVLLWNLLVYLALVVQQIRGRHSDHGWFRRLVRAPWMPGRPRKNVALAAYATAWTKISAPLAMTRAALLVHLAAGALALGLIGGMYLRGLVLDYRAGWQSTFLDAPAVHAVLSHALVPASVLTGIPVPDVDTLAQQRVGPDVAATADAAPWIHLYAAMLGLFVVTPRFLLALWAAFRGWRLSKRWLLPWQEPYFQQLIRQYDLGGARVQVVPHAGAPSAQAALSLRALLVPSLGEDFDLRIAAPVQYGDEEAAAAVATELDTTLRLALFDLGATPEAEAHGRLLSVLRESPAPLIIVTDEAAFVRRFGAFPERVAERRATWRSFAETERLPWLAVNLEHPDPSGAAILQRTLETRAP
jgi:hypothetical protein